MEGRKRIISVLNVYQQWSCSSAMKAVVHVGESLKMRLYPLLGLALESDITISKKYGYESIHMYSESVQNCNTSQSLVRLDYISPISEDQKRLGR